jgi:hypothetical protein
MSRLRRVRGSVGPCNRSCVLHIDCRLPDDPDEEAEFIAAAELVASGDLLALFRINLAAPGDGGRSAPRCPG